MPTFSPDQRRDAYAVLAGFVYQIDRTVDRWLALDDRSVLLCESGEDIDSAGLLDDGISIDEASLRLSEQVKRRRGRPISLASAEARKVLGEYLAARQRNSDIAIRYRYFTNAPVGREKSARFPQSLPGIGAWRRIQAGKFSPTEVAATLRALRTLAGAAPKSDPKSPEQRLAAFLSTATPQTFVDDLVEPFEWSTDNLDHPQIRAAVLAKLQADGYAADPQIAEVQYQALFVHVIKLLTERGEKRLERAGLLMLLSEPVQPAAAQALFARIDHGLQHLKAQVEALHARVERTEAEVRRVGARLSQDVAVLRGDVTNLRSGLTARPGAMSRGGAVIVSDEPPDVPAAFVRRAALARTVAGQLDTNWWVSVHGPSGTGKSLLARTVASARTSSWWINLEGATELTHEHLAEQVVCWHRALGGDPGLEASYADGRAAFGELVHAVGARAGGALLVLDGVPDLTMQPALLDRVTRIAGALRSAGLRILATSQYAVPARVRALVGTGFIELASEYFARDDIAELLGSAGAPPETAEQLADAVLATTEGHPTLVQAAAAWLHDRAWVLDGAALATLIAGEPLRLTREEARRTLGRTVADAEALLLLDRLSIVGAAFGRAILDAVAAVHPSIRAARNRLDALIGPWVLRRGALFDVSPLLTNVGEEYLDRDERVRVHATIADAYLAAGSLYAAHSFWVCTHYIKARAWSKLGGVLVSLGFEMEGPADARAIDWLRFLFPPASPWPDELPTGLRILVRTVQLRVLRLLDVPADAYVEDLDQLVPSATEDVALPVALARLQAALADTGASSAAWGRRALEAARAVRIVPAVVESPAEASDLAPEALVWGAVARLRTRQDVVGVMDLISSMTDEERGLLLAAPIAPQMALSMMDSVYAFEADQPEAERAWSAVLGVLADAETRFASPDVALLRAAALRAEAIVLADYMGDIDGALDRLRDASWASGHARFLLDFTEASILFAKRRDTEAAAAFATVLAFPGLDQYGLVNYDARVKGALVAARVGQVDEAMRLGAAAFWALRRVGPADAYEPAELLAELAWIRWVRGERVRACALLDQAVAQIIAAADPRADRYAEVAIKVGHLAVWITSVARTGAPPASPGLEPATEPFPGLTWARRPSVVHQYPTPSAAGLSLQIGRAATACGDDRIALRASRRAVAAASQAGALVMAHLLESDRARAASVLGEFDEAVGAAIRAFRAASIARDGRDTSPEDDATDPNDAWQRVPDPQKNETERLMLFGIVLLPAFVRAIASPSDKRAEALSELARLREAVDRHRTDLRVADEHLLLIERVASAVDGTLRRADVAAWAASDREQADNHNFTRALCMGIADGMLPREIVAGQAYALTEVSKLGADFVPLVRLLAGWTLRTWPALAEPGAESPGAESPGRAAHAAPMGAVDTRSAARILLAAESVTAAGLPPDAHDLLSAMASGG